MKNFLTVGALLLVACAGTVLAQSDPTPHQVYEAARSGHLAEARQMINQVLRDHPRSAEAHYVAAELSAREGNLAAARQQLAVAEEIAPGLPFLKSRTSLQELQAQLAQGQRGATFAVPYSRPQPASIPWGAILLIVGAIAVVWTVIRRRSAAAYSQYPPGTAIPGGVPPPGYGPGYGPGYAGPAPGIGSGIAGGLASGLAVGAGVVAGEELARHFLDSDRPTGGIVPPAEAGEANPNPDMGGSDFGVSDAGSWDDSSGGDSFGGGDFGGGGDDWT